MILWWWFNGNWYNIITILIPIESKWWAKWWQNVGKYMLYWKCVGTYLEHHLKFIWNYEHHVSQHGTSYDYMMNIWWTLYEICMNTVATCGNQVNGSKISTCQTWKTGWRITGWPVHPQQWPLCWRCHIPILMGFFLHGQYCSSSSGSRWGWWWGWFCSRPVPYLLRAPAVSLNIF